MKYWLAFAGVVMAGLVLLVVLMSRADSSQDIKPPAAQAHHVATAAEESAPNSAKVVEATPAVTQAPTLIPSNSFLLNAIRKCINKPTGKLSADDLNMVTSLVLDDPYITDASLSEIAGLPNLVSLYLGFNERVTDAGIAHLAKCSKLTTLSLDFTNTTDVALRELAKLKGLTCLGLTKTKVTEEGVDQLNKDLPSCVVLQVQTGRGGREVNQFEVLSKWAKVDPEMAVSWMYISKDAGQKLELTSILATYLTVKNPEKAAAWALSLLVNGEGNVNVFFEAVYTVLKQWTKDDPPKAAAWAEYLDSNEKIGYGACRKVGEAWVQRDPVKAAAWARSIKGNLPRLQALSAVGWTKEDLQREGELARAMKNKGKLPDCIVRGWWMNDPVKAESLARSLEDEKARSDALYFLAITWPGNFSENVESVVRSLGDKEERNTTLAILVKRFSGQRGFKDAIRLAELIEGPSERSESLAHITVRYYKAEPEAAKAWVETMPAEDQKRMKPLINDPKDHPGK